MTTMADAQIYANAYNTALTRGFDSLGAEQLEEAYMARAEALGEIQNLVFNLIQGWDQEPLETGETAQEILERQAAGDEFWDFVHALSYLIDEDLSDAVKLELRKRPEETQEVFRSWIEAAKWDEDAELGASAELQSAVIALRLLGQWEDSAKFERWILRFSETEKPAPIWAEAIVDYAKAVPEVAIEVLGRFLSEAESTAEDTLSLQGREYLLVSLTEATKVLKQDSEYNPELLQNYDELSSDVYMILRSYFLRHEPRVIAAICLGDLGHPRAVPLLRNYVIRNENDPDKLDRQLYYEILSSIKRLGGDTSDLPDPFRDFSGGGGGRWPSL